MEQLINNLKKRLEQPLPGSDAQYKLAPINRERLEISEQTKINYRNSAVMVLFCLNDKNDWFIPLTERMSYGGVHSGQISFPGGKHENGDKDFLHTALRECYEEIGVNEIEPIGQLTELFIPVSGFLVKPYIGFCKIKNPQFKPQQREVKEILHLRINDLITDQNIKHGVIEVNENLKIKSPYIDMESKKVWGATAMILSELREILIAIS